MSSAFTTVDTGASYDPLDVAIYNELILAVQERMAAIKPMTGDTNPPIDRAVGGDALKIVPYNSETGYSGWNQVPNMVGDVRALQEWMDNRYQYFLDDTLDNGSGEFVGKGTFPVFTLARWRSSAGLHASGWRRATAWTPAGSPDWETDVSFSYGAAQAGDIMGPWIYEDLQAGLSALKWTQYAQWSNKSDAKLHHESNSGASCALALAAERTAWAAWITAGSNWLTFSTSRKDSYGVYNQLIDNGASWTADCTRGVSRESTTLFPATNAASIDEYYAVTAASPYTFKDIDSLGLAGANTYFRHNTIAEATNATRTGAYFGDIDTDPSTLPLASPLTCPNAERVGNYAPSGASFGPLWVAKWNFTNSN